MPLISSDISTETVAQNLIARWAVIYDINRPAGACNHFFTVYIRWIRERFSDINKQKSYNETHVET
jgi:hypothetical protein